MNVLFICSRNQWRSPTAEAVWRNLEGISVRSAGTSPKAKRTVNANDIRWADFIFVMESKHKQRLKARFKQLMDYQTIEVLDIPDDYQFMDDELVTIFENEAQRFVQAHQNT